jgi:hypothetical protein
VIPTLSIKPTYRSVNTNRTICPYFWGINTENVRWLAISGGVVVVRTDKQSYGHTSLLITLLQLVYWKLALRLNNVAVDAECLGGLDLVIVVVMVAIGRVMSQLVMVGEE